MIRRSFIAEKSQLLVPGFSKTLGVVLPYR
jgi:hypothetical protein